MSHHLAQSNEDNYAIGAPIARGGMGSVLEAQDRKLNRKVALKVMAFDAFSDASLRQRFIREAQVLARLAHPNIVPIHDMVWEDDVPQFYTMKLVQGRTLQAILDDLRKGDLATVRDHPLDHLLASFLKVCDAMAFAHSQGVVHRDLKPENVMIGEFGEVLVMDWGLAGLDGDEPPTFHLERLSNSGELDLGLTLTMDGVVMGSPRYMAPEQAAGRVDEIDHLSDVYALGGILHAILTLSPPVDGNSVREVLGKIASGQITRPTEIHACEGKAPPSLHLPSGQVPKRLSSVTMKALSLDRSARYQSVRELATDINAYQQGFATSAHEIGAIGQLLLLMQRHRAVTASLASVFLISVAFMFKLSATAESERRAAESERRTAYSAQLAQALGARARHDFGQARQLLGAIDPDLREFDWRLLEGICQGDEVASFQLGFEPQCLAILPGKGLAFISAIGEVHRHDFQGSMLVKPRKLPVATGDSDGRQRYDGLEFSPQGTRLAYTKGDVLQVIDTNTFAVLYKEVSRFPQFAWLDEERLLFGFNGSESPPPFPEAGAWMLDFSGSEVSKQGFPEMCAPLAVSQDGRFFVLHRVDTAPTSWARTLHLYHTEQEIDVVPEPIYAFPGREYPGKLAFSRSGDILAFSAGTTLKQTVRVLDVAVRRVLFDHAFRFPINGLAIDPQEQRLGLVGEDSVVRLYDFTRGLPESAEEIYDDDVDPTRAQRVEGLGAHVPPRDLLTRSAEDGRAWFYFGHEKRVLDVAFDAAGSMYTMGGDATIRQWPKEVARPAVRVGYQDTTYPLWRPAASVDGRQILFKVDTEVWQGDVALLKSQRKDAVKRMGRMQSPLAVLRDGRSVTMDDVSGGINIWSLDQSQVDVHIDGYVSFYHNGQVGGGVLSQDEQRLIGKLAGQLFCADLANASIAWSGDLGRVTNAFANRDLSPDGQWIASTDFGPRVAILRFDSPQKIVAWLGGRTRDYDTAVAFSRDGRLLYTGNEDGRVRVWETETWRELSEQAWSAHFGAVTALALSHDRRLIATSGDDTLKLFPTGASGLGPRAERLSFHLPQPANWIQFARDEGGRDRALLHSVPGHTLEVWETDATGAQAEISEEIVFPRNHAAVRLVDDKVLIVGGETHIGSSGCVAVSTCLLYDPESETRTRTGTLRTPRTRFHTVTLLANGKVLVAGGLGRGGAPLTSCELYDPESGRWEETGAMASPHVRGAQILLWDGQVLAVGGEDKGGLIGGPCERYDPISGAWSSAGVLTQPQQWTNLALLEGGSALAAGGVGTGVRYELYDPIRATWRPAASSPAAGRYAQPVVPLPSGAALIVAPDASARIQVTEWTEGVVREVGSPDEPWRFVPTCTQLADGRILLTGGLRHDQTMGNSGSRLYDPSHQAWEAAPALKQPRRAHTATELADGTVLVVGGLVDDRGTNAGVEILDLRRAP